MRAGAQAAGGNRQPLTPEHKLVAPEHTVWGWADCNHISHGSGALDKVILTAQV